MILFVSCELCSLHREKLDFFCLEDKQPVCLVCRDSQEHINHTFRPIGEAVSSYKEELITALKPLRQKLKCCEYIQGTCVHTVKHIKVRKQNQESFEKLHQFLRDEEEATITALREEEEQKKQMIEKLNRDISALSHSIKYMEEMMKASDVCFLKEFPDSMERVQISSQPDPQTLIDVPRYLGNLPFRVWKKMQDIVQNTPVILDPNTAHPDLVLSDDLTSVEYRIHCGGFNSGTHCWDVKVKGCLWWSVGVTTASNQRKGRDFFNADVWSVQCRLPEKSMNEFPVEQCLDRVRVYLDYDRGTVSFSDPVTNTHLHTFTTTFTDTVLPFFHSRYPLRILPLNS
uniref:B box-type domain-containing protein n=1 Tax=Sinocyclocheilus rhinocerous TaxID=307959 RepID=A0A673LQD3_9TELE